jgi:polar amino acid transport system permease protein
VTTQISNANFSIVELLIVASIWYLAMTSVLTFGQYYLERYFARGSSRMLPPTPLQRFRRLLLHSHDPLAVGPVEPMTTPTSHHDDRVM